MIRADGSFSVVVSGYTLICTPSGRGSIDKTDTELFEEFHTHDPDTDLCSIVLQRSGDRRPFLIVVQEFSSSGGFEPGLLLIPETKRLFIGAGERLLAYDLERPRRLWEDHVACGFWQWDRFGETVLMAAELELTAFDIHGRKIWTSFVEPPWSYRVENGVVHLDIMGMPATFSLISGPSDREGSLPAESG